MQDFTLIDARVSGYMGEPARLLALTLNKSGKILIKKIADWKQPVERTNNLVVVTDTPAVFGDWDMQFIEHENIAEVLRNYLEVSRSGLLELDRGLLRYDPRDVIQATKMDARGIMQEFDQNLTNGHMAVLLAIWAARRAYSGYAISSSSDNPDSKGQLKDNTDYTMMPFSV